MALHTTYDVDSKKTRLYQYSNRNAYQTKIAEEIFNSFVMDE